MQSSREEQRNGWIDAGHPLSFSVHYNISATLHARPMPLATHLLPIIADPRRQEILRVVWDEEVPAGAIAHAMPDITFGAVSQHLKILRDAGLVTVRRDGRLRWYRADRTALGPLADILAATWTAHLMDLRRLAEADEKRKGKRRKG